MAILRATCPANLGKSIPLQSHSFCYPATWLCLANRPASRPAQAQSDVPAIKEVARELEVDEGTVRRWLASGELPYTGYDIKGRYLIARSDLNEFVRRRTQKKPD